MSKAYFEWDENKNIANQKKHGISFYEAQNAFLDLKRIIKEERYYCFGSVNNEIVTVRFTYRDNVIRIIGAGFWRNGRVIYEKANS